MDYAAFIYHRAVIAVAEQHAVPELARGVHCSVQYMY